MNELDLHKYLESFQISENNIKYIINYFKKLSDSERIEKALNNQLHHRNTVHVHQHNVHVKKAAVHSDFEKRGVKLFLFEKIKEEAIKRNNSEGYWTIAKVSAEIIGNHEIFSEEGRFRHIDPNSTLTYSEKSSFIDVLLTNYSESKHPVLDIKYSDVVGEKANIFVSFAYSSDFTELVDSLESFFEMNPNFSKDKTYFWFDMFVNNQWQALVKSFEWWATTFREAVIEIGRTVCILSPWDNPLMLTRVW